MTSETSSFMYRPLIRMFTFTDLWTEPYRNTVEICYFQEISCLYPSPFSTWRFCGQPPEASSKTSTSKISNLREKVQFFCTNLQSAAFMWWSASLAPSSNSMRCFKLLFSLNFQLHKSTTAHGTPEKLFKKLSLYHKIF